MPPTPKIQDAHGEPVQTGQLTTTQTAGIAEALSMVNAFQMHPSRGLSPARLSRILEMAEHGHLLSQLELHEDMLEKDGHLFAELAKRQRALLTVDWDVVPPPNPSPQEKSAAQELRERLEEIDDFEDVILGAAAAIGPAFSCQEIEWELAGGDWMPKCIEFRPHTWFTLDRETRQEIRLRTTNFDGEPLIPFGWIAHIHRAKPGYLARSGLMRQLCWPFLFKTYAIGDLAEFLEIYGLPIRTGTYPPNAAPEEKATLLRAVVAMGHDAAGIIPEGMKIEFQEAADGKEMPFMAMIDLMERTQSKVILGATLTSQADGKSSTNALGRVHNEVRLDILQSDARQIAGTLTRDLVFPIGMLNGVIKDARRRPRFRFDVQEEEDFKTMAESMKTVIVDMRLPVGKQWVYDQLRIPIPADNDELVTPPPVPAVQPPVPGPADPTAASARSRRVLAALAAALQPQQEFPDQAALDAAIDALDPAELQRQIETVIAPVAKLIAEGQSFVEVKAKLASLYPDMDTARLQAALERMFFVADLWGAASAEANAGAH